MSSVFGIKPLRSACIVIGLLANVLLVGAQTMPADYQEVLRFLGRTGDYKENVLKIGLPRNDVRVTIDATPVPTPFGFGGWIAMTKGDGGNDVMMGDLVL